jgi:nucleoid-associated protein YgaU
VAEAAELAEGEVVARAPSDPASGTEVSPDATLAEVPGEATVAALDDGAVVRPAVEDETAAAAPVTAAATDGGAEATDALRPADDATAEAEAEAATAAEAEAETVAAVQATGDAATPGADTEPAPEPAPVVSVVAPDLVAPEAVAEAAPPVLVSDAEGVRVVQPALAPGAGPEVLATVAVDAITYDADGGVDLAGRARGEGGTVRIYVDNAPLADVAVGADGQWQADLTALDPGVYTLRVDQLGEDGQVTSRMETPFLREEREVIAAAMAEETAATGFEVAVRIVQPGNTLWAIARDRYGDGVMYVQVFEANRDRIRNPDLIYPGQLFMLPEGLGTP